MTAIVANAYGSADVLQPAQRPRPNVGADEVLIDNFAPDEMREAVAVRDEMNPAVRLEASGGLTLDSARAVAETGVDYIAVGELTHSARVLDIGLDLRAV